MAEKKTRPTGASVDDYVAAIVDQARRADCRQLIQMMSRLRRQRTRRSCLCVKRLADLDTDVLEQPLRQAVHEMRRRHGGGR